jgi:hypothetical protein
MEKSNFDWDEVKILNDEIDLLDQEIDFRSMKTLKREDILPNYNPKKFSVTVHYDLTNQTEDDIYNEILEDEADKIKCLIHEKIKGIPRGKQLNDKLETIYEAIGNC